MPEPKRRDRLPLELLHLGRLVQRGVELAPGVWWTRHRAVLLVLWLHTAALLLYLGQSATPDSIWRSLIELTPLVALSVLASWGQLPRRLRSLAAASGLAVASVLLVFLSNGADEGRMHFFFVIVVVALYQDWAVLLLPLGIVILSQPLASVLDDQPNVLALPWDAIDAAFVLAVSAATVATWRLGEQAQELERERASREQAARLAAEAEMEVRTEARVVQSRLLSELGVANERYRLALQAARDVIYDNDLLTDTVFWSPNAREIFGYEPDEIGSTAAERMGRIHPDDRDRATEVFATAVRHGGPYSLQYRYRRKDGSYIDVLTRGEVLLDGTGRSVRAVGSMTDITAPKRVEEALRVAEERYRLVLEVTRDVIFDNDLERGVIYFSPSTLQMFGYGPEEMAGGVEERIANMHPDDQERARREISSVLQDGVSYTREHRHRRKDGRYIHVLTRGQTLLNAEGRPYRTMGSMTDVTAARELEEALQASEERYRLAVQATRDVIYDNDLVAGVIHWSPNTRDMFGYEPEEMARTVQGGNERFHPEDSERAGREIAAAISRGGPYAVEYRYRRKDGSYVDVVTRGMVLLDASGRPVRAVGSIADTTRRKQDERDLREARDAALAASAAKSAFLATMSHEIRTPLNALLGMAEVLVDTPLTEEQGTYLQTLRRAGDGLLHLINDVLDLSRIESGQVVLEHMRFDPRELVAAVAALFAGSASAKGLTLLAATSPDVPLHLVGDPTRVRQVLLNLVGNAVKFTASGEVEIRLQPDPAGATPGAVSFIVRDTGIGIPPDKRAAVFQRFTQADTSTTRVHGGTGLGLTISAQLAELMGGRITIEDQTGPGTTIRFWVQFETEASSELLEGGDAHLAGVRLLVVARQAADWRAERQLLEHWGAMVTIAGGWAAALDHLDELGGAAAAFDVLLLDGSLPEAELVVALGRFRDLRGDQAAAILVLDSVTARVAGEQQLQGLPTLTRPVQVPTLLDAIEQARRQCVPCSEAPAEAVAAPPASELPELPALRLLLVDDSPDNRLVVRAFLKQTTHVLEVAEDGAQGVQAFKMAPYDLVLMDIQMPVMDGYDATRAIRAWERERGLPQTQILAFSADAMSSDIQRALAAGCNDYVTKPIKKDALLEAIARCARAAR